MYRYSRSRPNEYCEIIMVEGNNFINFLNDYEMKRSFVIIGQISDVDLLDKEVVFEAYESCSNYKMFQIVYDCKRIINALDMILPCELMQINEKYFLTKELKQFYYLNLQYIEKCIVKDWGL